MNKRLLLPQVPFSSCDCWLHIKLLIRTLLNEFLHLLLEASLSAVNNFHCTLYMTPQGERHKSNSYSIIRIAYGGVELKPPM